MIVKFSQFNCDEKPILVLKNLDETAIQTLGYAFGIEADFSYNELSTLTFKLPAYVDGQAVPGYENVVGMRIVDLVGYGQFLLIDPEEESDGISKVKTCKAYSLEYEFAKKTIFLEAGTFNFYNGIDVSDENTIVGRIHECLPDWRFNIDESLIGRYRTFDDVSKKVYEFIKSDVQEKYRCIFDFDTYNRMITVRDVDAVVPTNQVYLSSENLIHKIKIDEDSDSIVTRLDVNGAEDVTIRSVNPTGTNKIYNLDYFMNTNNFSQEFINKWRKWEEDYAAKQVLYYDTTMSYNMKLLAILTKEAEIADLEAELVSQENIRGAKVQLIAQSSSNETKEQQEKELKEVNSEISEKKAQISSLKAEVESMKSAAANIHQNRIVINDELSFDKYFTENELSVLRRYFIDDTLQDSSFVAETAASYIEQDYSLVVDKSQISVTGASEVIETIDANGNRVISFAGGSLTMNSLLAKMIRGTLYFETNGSIVFSGYAESGKIGDTSFVNGSITVSGNYSSLSNNSQSLSFAISSGRLYFTEKCSEYKQHQIEWELYEYGKQVLREHASPTYNFDVECSNFLTIDDYLLFQRQLTLGQKVYLYLDNEILEPYVVAVHVNFSDPTDFSIEFSSTYTSFDKKFSMSKLLEDSYSMGKTLSYKSGMYSAFVNSGASTAVKDFMGSALDISKNAVLSSENQAISFDDTGIRIRKWADGEKTHYEPEEIWMIDNVIAFTDDNWSTSKMAIGKIFDPNFVTSDNPEGLKYGIAAPYIVGTLLAGENLVIDTENGAFKVDSSGVYIDALKFVITHGESSENLDNYLTSRENEVSKNFKDAIEEATKSLEDAIGDGYVTTYYSSEFPTDSREGDLWYVDSEEDIVYNDVTYEATKLYRYNGTSWEIIKDADITQAIIDAANAQATADKKIVSYYSAETPAAPGYGDIWYVTGENSNGYNKGKLYRYNGTEWELVEDNDIPVIKNEISSTKKTLSSIINENGCLKADQMQGVINAQATQMKSAAGNVLFDDQGLWLMNSPNKFTMTRAVWANENGILIGTGNASDNPAEEWNWTTAIGPDGIVASAIAAGTLSGMNILGGDLNIGPIKNSAGEVTGYNFVVDENGNVTANSGTFTGTIKAEDILFNDGKNYKSILNTSNQIEHDYLNLKGLTIKNGSTTTFAVDSTTGAVTINGATSISGNITMSGGSINWDKVADNGALKIANEAAEDAADALDEASNAVENAASALEAAVTAEERATAADELANALLNGEYDDGTQITGMYIYSPNIYSPNIYANKYSIIGAKDDNWLEGHELLSIYVESNESSSFKGRTVLNFDSLASAGIIAYSLAFSCYQLDFSQVSTIYDPNDLFSKGGTTTAVFG